MPRLSVIVPTYNESQNLTALAARIHQALDGLDYEIVVVDDDSPDGTAQIAQTLSSTYPITVVCRKQERGLATAVVSGFIHAKGEVFAVIDADLQHPPEIILNLLRALDDGADVAIASRYMPGGGIEGWSTTRRIISKGATLLARLALPAIRKAKDPLSGFFMLRRQVVRDVKLKPIGYKILLEILVRGRPAVVREVPYVFEVRARGESKLGFQEQIRFLQHIAVLERDNREAIRFLRFCLVGLSGAGVNIAAFWLLTRVFGLYDLIALILAIETSILSNFTLNEIWTFRDRRTPSAMATLKRALKFNLVSAGAVAIYYGVYLLFTRGLGIHDILALVVGIGMGFLWNFAVNTAWTWRSTSLRT